MKKTMLLLLLLASPALADDRVTVGMRVERSWLTDSRRGDKDHFLGSLWGLDSSQSYLPSPFLEVRITGPVGMGLAYGQARVRTLDWADSSHTVAAGDGDLQLRGGEVYAFARARNRSRVTPYARVGYARYWSDFVELPGWPGHFETGTTRGWTAGAGVRVALWKGCGLDVLYEHRSLGPVAAVAMGSNGVRTDGAFPVRSNALSLGVVYSR